MGEAGRQIGYARGKTWQLRRERVSEVPTGIGMNCGAPKALRADGGAEGVGEGLAEALDVGFVFGFDHDAGELLGAGVTEDDAAIVAEGGLGFG